MSSVSLAASSTDKVSVFSARVLKVLLSGSDQSLTVCEAEIQTLLWLGVVLRKCFYYIHAVWLHSFELLLCSFFSCRRQTSARPEPAAPADPGALEHQHPLTVQSRVRMAPELFPLRPDVNIDERLQLILGAAALSSFLCSSDRCWWRRRRQRCCCQRWRDSQVILIVNLLKFIWFHHNT